MATGMTGSLPEPVDWKTFWETDHSAEDWLIEPLIPKGRQVGLFAPAKVGKSLLALDVAARMTTGRTVFGGYCQKVHTIYLDMEMTESDLAERLEDMGYGPDTDFSCLHYYLLPSLPPLDTKAGGEALMKLVKRHDAEFLVIDTMSRVISGKENDSDTVIQLYQHTGSLLKAQGVTVLRLDHAGKKLEAGQRGSSAKNDDLDLVWELSGSAEAFVLRATHRRQSWIPEEIKLVRKDLPFRHEIEDAIVSQGALVMVRMMEELDIPLDWGARKVRKALIEAGKGARNNLIAEAIRYRKQKAPTCPQNSGTHTQPSFGDTFGDTVPV